MFKRKVTITRIKKGEKVDTEDVVLIEVPVDISVNDEPLVDVICLPKNLRELGVGFLYSIGIINSYSDIEKIDVDELDFHISIELKDNVDFRSSYLELNPVSRVIDTTCGISSPWRAIIKKALEESKQDLRKDNLTIKADIINSAIIEMQKNTELFRETGGCHGAAIFDLNGKLLCCKEDIGRHNAIDKVIGEMMIKGYPFDKVFLTSTGRLTGDSVLKAVRASIPIVASLSTAIESGIRLAFGYGITLIGFVRGGRMNIYTHTHRVQL